MDVRVSHVLNLTSVHVLCNLSFDQQMYRVVFCMWFDTCVVFDVMNLYTYFMMHLVMVEKITTVLCMCWIVNSCRPFIYMILNLFTYCRPAVYNYSSSNAGETVCYCGLCHYLCAVCRAVPYCYQKHWDGLQLLLGSRGWNDLSLHCWHGELNQIIESLSNWS